MYEAGTATNISDLLSKLNTFAGTAGWTVDHYAAGDRLFLTRTAGGDTCSVALLMASASPTCLALYHQTAFDPTGGPPYAVPGSHTNDSGLGFVGTINDANLLTGRHVLLVNSSMPYWFFEDDNYLHIVVEAAAQQFRHFGFGVLAKSDATWTGGAYCYGWRNVGVGSSDGAVLESTTYLLDGLVGSATAATQRPFVATVHIESLAGQTASGKWGLAWAGGIANVSTDRGGTARENLQGGYRGGPIARAMARFGGTVTSGLVPGYPIGAWYQNRASTARWLELGYMPDVRGFNVKDFSGGDEIVIASDTWLTFPARYKTVVSAAGGTRRLGMIYRKVTT